MIAKTLYCILVAAAYQVVTNPFVLALLLALFGYWEVGAWLLAVYLLLCAASIVFGVHRKSRLTGADIFTAPDALFLFGNEQEGQDPAWYRILHPTWPWWLRAFVFCAWRNKTRNLPFVGGFEWLHKPRGTVNIAERKFGNTTIRVRTRGWMTEVEYFTKHRFGDFGPRLDQPDEWGAVSWAFRPYGSY